jgi:transposase
MKALGKIKLKAKEKKVITDLLNKGSEKARTLTRCRVLLLLDKGERTGVIQKTLSIDSKTVTNIWHKYQKNGLESTIYERPRSGAPTIFDGKLKAKITALACSNPPEGYGKWSLRMLADRAVELDYVDSISHTEVGKILKKTT